MRRVPVRLAVGMAGLLLIGGTSSVTAQTVTPTPQFSLTGVVILERGLEMAMLVEPTLTQGNPLMVKKGDSIGPYRLVSVQPDRVVLQSGAQEITVALGGTPVQAKPVSTGAVVPPPAPVARGVEKEKGGQKEEEAKPNQPAFNASQWIDELTRAKGGTSSTNPEGIRVHTFPTPPPVSGDKPGLSGTLR